jgi:hypothetical protein
MGTPPADPVRHTRRIIVAKKPRGTKAGGGRKSDPFSFNFGANVRPRGKKGKKKPRGGGSV